MDNYHPPMRLSLKARLLDRARRVSIRRSQRAVLDAEGIGFGLAVSGAIAALAGLLGVLFVSSATFPTIDAEMAAFFGAILLVAGIIVEKAGN